jgi:ATP-binding cassette subfamily B protein
VEFSGVTFKYKGASAGSQQHVSPVPKGHASGQEHPARTTITRLLQRLHYDGLIKMDGTTFANTTSIISPQRRRRAQENFLFSGTIRENIAATKPDSP